MLSVVISLILTLPVLTLLRWIMSRRLQALMMRKSPSAGDPLAAFLETPEVAMETTPRLEVIMPGEVPAHASARRAAAARIRRGEFIGWWGSEMLASLAYLGCGVLGMVPALLATAPGAEPALPATAIGLSVLGAAYALIVTLRLGFYIRQYSLVQGAGWLGAIGRVLGMVMLALPRMLIHPPGWWVSFALTTAIAAGIGLVLLLGIDLTGDGTTPPTTLTDRATVLAALLAVALHLWLRRNLTRRIQQDDSPHLVILRVFGLDRNAFLTFGHLLRSWRHFGPSYTVIDPSYFRYRYRGLSLDNLAVVLWISVPVGVLLSLLVLGTPDEALDATDEGTQMLMFEIAGGILIAALIGIGYTAKLVWMYLRAPATFARDADQIEERIADVHSRPRKSDLTFRDLHLCCFDNTWRIAVDRFTGNADVVLMDLRGFTEERQGCEYEVDFLFDRIEIGRVLFVVDAKTDLDGIERLLRARWAELRVSSPNRHDPDPVARVYVCRRNRPAEVRDLLDLLFCSAAHRSAAEEIRHRMGTAVAA